VQTITPTNSSTEGDHVNRIHLRRIAAAGAAVGVSLALAAPALAAQGSHGYPGSDLQSQPATAEGAGSTFAAPLENAGINEYQRLNPNASFTGYLAVGSGAGEKDVVNGQTTGVDWGATDVPFGASSSDLASACAGTCPGGTTIGSFTQIPIGLGGEAIIYNIKPTFPKVRVKVHGVFVKKQVQFDLNLTGRVIAEIYNGTIQKWNNSKIKALNPGVGLPSTTIFPVDRADSSGTQYIMTNFLQVSTGSTVGCTSCVWPWAPSKSTISSYDKTGGAGNTIGVAGNPNTVNSLHNGGVAATVGSTHGAIGFVEDSYVLLNPKLKQGVANIYNKARKYVAPTAGAVAADAAHFSGISAANFSIVFGAGSTSYPIAGYTWAIVWTNFTASNADISSVPSGVTAGSVNQYADEVGALTVKYLDWLSHTSTSTSKPGGQNVAAANGYVAMPTSVQSYATSQLAKITGSAADGTPELLSYNP
jgi:phosphate transport system substrate-binding protein